MNDSVNPQRNITPMLFPFEPEKFWDTIRKIISEELEKCLKNYDPTNTGEVPGLTYNPLVKIPEVCKIFGITKPTIYEWVKEGKLWPFKIGAKVYFLRQDIENLIPKPKL